MYESIFGSSNTFAERTKIADYRVTIFIRLLGTILRPCGCRPQPQAIGVDDGESARSGLRQIRFMDIRNVSGAVKRRINRIVNMALRNAPYSDCDLERHEG